MNEPITYVGIDAHKREGAPASPSAWSKVDGRPITDWMRSSRASRGFIDRDDLQWFSVVDDPEQIVEHLDTCIAS